MSRPLQGRRQGPHQGWTDLQQDSKFFSWRSILAKNKTRAHNSMMPPATEDMTRHVSETITKYRMLEKDDRVLVGVSGGADSISLMLALKELGYALGVAHVNHGLRGVESDDDERFVWQLALKLGLPFFAHRIVIQPGSGNIEQTGRDARKEFFKSVANRHEFNRIAVAHTSEDRIETCLLHLIRGAGIEGMVSMAPVSGSTVRPLIEASRNDIETFLNSRKQCWRTDATNSDLAFSRNLSTKL